MSVIVDPPDGRVPALTPQARQRAASRAARPTSDAQENDPGFEGPAAYDDMERRPLGERCLLGFGSTSGPPALPVLYNNLHQIVQTRDTVLILNEMVHDARVVRMNERAPAERRSGKWLGDSVGRWDGDTLVVDTTNFTDKTRFRGSSENLHVVERFTRIDAGTLRYRFTVEDPSTWVSAWSGEDSVAGDQRSDVTSTRATKGNYALGNILSGARLREQREPVRNATRSRRRLSAGLCVRFISAETRSTGRRRRRRTTAPATPARPASATIGGTRPSPASVTFRRTVSAKIVPSSRHTIFTANGVL